MKKKKRRGMVIFFAVIALGVSLSIMTRDGQRRLDVLEDKFRSSTNYLRYKMGQKLPGTPDLTKLEARLTKANLKLGNAIFMRIFKLEGKLELWMMGGDGFQLFATYPICRWSGKLGPKLKEGDRQSPEGFYTVSKGQLNPNSRWYRSFNLGFPNLFDKSHKRTGSFLMVHGGCSSIGCYAMTNPVMGELWHIINKAFAGGQKRFAVHVFPFRMTNHNMFVYGDHKWIDFWQDLKAGYDMFELTRIPPKVTVCNKRYMLRTLEKGNGSQMIKNSCEVVAGQF